jgi:hypothetical protein
MGTGLKILFFAINNGNTPLFERELELMANHQEKGDDVYVMRCAGSLERCYSNPEHLLARCMYCKLRFSEGIKKLKLSASHIFALNQTLKEQNLPAYFASVDELKGYELHGVDFGMAVASYLISEIKDHKFDTLLYQDRVAKTLRSSLLVYESVIDLFNKIPFDLVYIFNGRFHDVRPVVRACQQRNINYITHERGGSYKHYYLVKNSLIHDLELQKNDLHRTVDSASLEALEKATDWFYIQRGGGNYYQSFLRQDQEADCLPAFFDRKKTNIVLFNSSYDELEAISYKESSIYEHEIDACTRIAQAFKDQKNIHFYFRVHPNLKLSYHSNQIKDLENFKSQAPANWTFIMPSEKVDSYALIEACDKAISLSSTMAVEATFWGTPSILIGNAVYEDLGCCYVAKSHQDVVEWIKNKLEPKPRLTALKYAYWLQNWGETYTRYQPLQEFEGIYEGRPLLPRYSLKKIPFWSVRLLEKLRGKSIKARIK